MPFSRPFGETYFQQRSAAKNPLESAKLDGEFNALEEYLNAQLNFIQNASEWNISQVIPTYISTTQFSLSGDVTGTYSVYRKIRVVIGTNAPVYSTVTASAHDEGTGLTTVTLADAILAFNIAELAYGIIGGIASESSFPINLLNMSFSSYSTTPITLSKFDGVVNFDSTPASIVVTLPLSSVYGPGKVLVLRKIDASNHTITLTPSGTEKIDGKDNVVLSRQFDTVILATKDDGYVIAKDLLSPLPPNLLPGVFVNLKVFNNATTPATKINVTCDAMMISDADGNVQTLTGISHTIDCSTTGVNGLDVGTLTNGSWYFIWEIARLNGTKAGLASLSATSPAMPAGYTYKRLISVIRYKTGAFERIYQDNLKVELRDLAQILSGFTGTTYTSTDLSGTIPAKAVRIWGQIASTTGLAVALAWDSGGSTGKRAWNTYFAAAFEGFMGRADFHYPLNPSAPQTVFAKVLSGTNLTLWVSGYELAL